MKEYIKIGNGVFKKIYISSIVVDKKPNKYVLEVVHKDGLIDNIDYFNADEAAEALIKAYNELNGEQNYE